MHRAFLLVALLAGCGGAPRLTFQAQGVERPARAWYSIAVEPLTSAEGGEIVEAGAYLVVTLIDERFACEGAPPSTEDALSFFFDHDAAGASTGMIAGRSGPTLGTTTGGDGTITLDAVDDRYVGLDGGTVDVADGGHVEGHVRFTIGGFVADGAFSAAHCHPLDFIVPG